MASGLSRREFLAAAGLAFAWAQGCRTRERLPPPGRKPSVLFLAIDDLRDWIGPLTPDVDFTPHIDALAARGTAFTRAYCQGGLCNPSRSSLLTGIAPWVLGIYAQGRLNALAPNAVTLPEHFAANGYRVVGGGKIFHTPTPRKFQEYFHKLRSPRPEQSLSGLLDEDEFIPAAHDARSFDWGPIETPVEQTPDGMLVEWAVSRLGREPERPLFLAVGINKPHLPWYAPKRFFDLHPVDSIRLPAVRSDDLADVGPMARAWVKESEVDPALLQPATARQAIRGYVAAIAFADELVGRLLAAWDASPHGADGIVVLWSDHGFHLGEKLHWRKATLWEESCRVPLIVAAPNRGFAPGPCGRVVSLLDVYPTLVELCGLPPVAQLEGQSLAPLLAAPETEWPRPSISIWTAPGSATVRSERWRYIRYADGFEELYDHDADPHEWTNLAGRPEFVDVVREHAGHLP